jgi:hypothetical protein
VLRLCDACGIVEVNGQGHSCLDVSLLCAGLLQPHVLSYACGTLLACRPSERRRTHTHTFSLSPQHNTSNRFWPPDSLKAGCSFAATGRCTACINHPLSSVSLPASHLARRYTFAVSGRQTRTQPAVQKRSRPLAGVRSCASRQRSLHT